MSVAHRSRRQSDKVLQVGSSSDDGKLVLSTATTVPTAEHYLQKFYSHDGSLTLRCWKGTLYRWNGRRYEAADEAILGRQLLLWLNRCVDEAGEQFPANPRSVKAVLDTLKLITALSPEQTAPCWLSDDHDGVDPAECIPLRNGIFHVRTKQLLEHTPEFFAVHGADFDHDDEAPDPVEWFKFLASLFGTDAEQLQLLREVFAYLLTADNSLQKIFVMVTPPRGGKGTLAHVATALIGKGSVCSPTLTSLNDSFGLEPLIGKSLAIFSDARFSGVESNQRLLAISGGDAINVNRKFQQPVQVVPGVRFLILSNELPKLPDASKALSRRIVLLTHDKSFLGSEDIDLEKRLLRELPGIFNWAVEAWLPLKTAGRFTVPSSTIEATQQLDELSSPVTAWVRDCCELGDGDDYRLDKPDAFQSWQCWCHHNGHKDAGTAADFGQKLKAATPSLGKCGQRTNRVRFYRGIRLR